MKRSVSGAPGRGRRTGTTGSAGKGLGWPLTLLVTAALACGPGAAPPFDVDVAVSPTPPIVGPGRVIVMVQSPDGGPLARATVTVEGQTQGGPLVRMSAAPEGPGLYTVDEFPFGRPGEWRVMATVVRVTGSVVDTVVAERSWRVSGR